MVTLSGSPSTTSHSDILHRYVSLFEKSTWLLHVTFYLMRDLYIYNAHITHRSSCERVDSIIDSHTTGTLSTELLIDYHHIVIIKLNVPSCVCGRSGKNFPIRSDPRH